MNPITSLTEFELKTQELRENSMILSDLITYAKIITNNGYSSPETITMITDHSNKLVNDINNIQHYINNTLIHIRGELLLADAMYADYLIHNFITLIQSLHFTSEI